MAFNSSSGIASSWFTMALGTSAALTALPSIVEIHTGPLECKAMGLPLSRVVYEAGSPGGWSGGAGCCDPIQISVHGGARGAGCSPDGVGG